MCTFDAFEESCFCFVSCSGLDSPVISFSMSTFRAVLFCFGECFNAFVNDFNGLSWREVCFFFENQTFPF